MLVLLIYGLVKKPPRQVALEPLCSSLHVNTDLL